ncbi:hypothetical protein E1218_23250 [Kribbella turkmenica]|uniref:Nodulation protein S (NodS) n=1 Tax=Kribbella turkmenica TaxID=2530375 RepID=A0A4R4WQF4_9ACTN|nr:SAM-dependent methyltransferase [Kribbella turkmenica]TDD19894.1 hypothetical protein E1218_23250 [Kribbella turkmenica]
MIDVLAVLRPEDAVTDFLPVLDPAHGREVHLLAAERGAYLRLPADVSLEARLAAIAALQSRSREGDKPFTPATAAAAIAREAGSIPFTVWTHHPSDTRGSHGRWAVDLATVIGGTVRHTMAAGEPVALDPVEVEASPYEQERLDATVEWVRRHLDPIAGRVIEVGAHEGALTRRLLADGYTVDATEPDERFLAQLRSSIAGDVRIHPHSFEDLATTARLTGSAYLLIEVLYYGQDLSLLDRFPTDRLFVAMEGGELEQQPWPAAWSVEDEVELVAPRLEELSGALLRKRGSHGVLLRRR